MVFIHPYSGSITDERRNGIYRPTNGECVSLKKSGYSSRLIRLSSLIAPTITMRPPQQDQAPSAAQAQQLRPVIHAYRLKSDTGPMSNRQINLRQSIIARYV